jgi:hypothetical protein
MYLFGLFGSYVLAPYKLAANFGIKWSSGLQLLSLTVRENPWGLL